MAQVWASRTGYNGGSWCPTSIWFWDLNPQPSELESYPITTRPGLRPTFRIFKRSSNNLVTLFVIKFCHPVIVNVRSPCPPISYFLQVVRNLLKIQIEKLFRLFALFWWRLIIFRGIQELQTINNRTKSQFLILELSKNSPFSFSNLFFQNRKVSE